MSVEPQILSQVSSLYRDFPTEKRNAPQFIASCSELFSAFFTRGVAPASNVDLPTKTAICQLVEMTALIALEAKDFSQFDTMVAILEPVYFQFPNQFPGSTLIVGLHLMRLLSNHHMSAFHLVIERIGDMSGDRFISFPIRLEQALMEGRYEQVLTCRSVEPAPIYNVFIDIIASSIRHRIAESLECAYRTLTLEDVTSLLLLEDSKLSLASTLSQQRGWTQLPNGVIQFPSAAAASSEKHLEAWLGRDLHIASELGKIA